MPIELKRTVSYFYDDGSESVLNVSVITFDNGDQSILIESDMGEASIGIYGMEQAKLLAHHIMTVAQEIFE